ncbi:hypothetical protein ANN_00822 [Periplaneta americana]|uniref:Uncharacterized protein n=1 Tax=Periplaneta americana TaxID=6978 RepID=A0ABQ8TSY4_PERAM|nr:hypothetical protein ANN_00822 [Periplaneta americana]
MDLRDVRYDGRDWINLAQDRDRWRAYVRVAIRAEDGAVRFGAVTDLLLVEEEEEEEEEENKIKARHINRNAI